LQDDNLKQEKRKEGIFTMAKKFREHLREEAGFTFIEIMIVVIIIGLLASIVAPQILSRLGQAQSTAAKDQIGTLQVALDQYYLDSGQYPTTEQGLDALRTKPTLSPVPNGWYGPYLQRDVPKDPWSNPYYFKQPGEHNTTSYDLYSLGKDGQEGGNGDNADINNWGNSQD
jgi:general secretion pathway protein G